MECHTSEDDEVGDTIEVDVIFGYPTEVLLLIIVKGTVQELLDIRLLLLAVDVGLDDDVFQVTVFLLGETCLKCIGTTILGCR